MKTRTAIEVMACQRAALDRHKAMQALFEKGLIGISTKYAVHSILGFARPHNTSRKRLARLKHSLTVLTLNQFRF